MELRRRSFLGLLLAALGAAATGVRGAVARAARAVRYPGPLRKFTAEGIRRPSHWAG